MTNRQWLNTLTNEELAHWILDKESSLCADKKSGKMYYDNLSPRLREVYAFYNDAVLRLIEWLDEERVDYSDGINFEEMK